MQTREKSLAVGLGVVLAVYAGRGVLAPLVQGPIDERERELAIATRAADAAEADELETMAAIKTLSGQSERAIGPDPLDAQRRYLAWLTDLAVACGWEAVELRPERVATINAASDRFSVRGTATATYPELVDFLQRFEAAGLLHGLTRLETEATSADPDGPLAIELAAQAVTVARADRRVLDVPPADGGVADWAAIASANPFAPPRPPAAPQNAPPELLLPDDVTIAASETVEDYAIALDPDGDDDKLRYRLAEPVEGATIDAESGEIAFDPPAVTLATAMASVSTDTTVDDGETNDDEADETKPDAAKDASSDAAAFAMLGQDRTYTLTIEAVDEAGEVASGRWTVTVSGNAAQTAELIGSLVIDEQPVALWVDRASGRTRQVRVGEALQVGEVDGEIETITPDGLEYRAGEDRYRWPLGRRLVDAVPLGT